MTLPSALSLFTALTLVLVALALSAFGLRQVRYAGWRWWLGAAWLAALGAIATALLPAPADEALGGLLLGSWPVVALMGLRRFHPRQALVTGEATDLLVLALACTGQLASLLLEPSASRVLMALAGAVPSVYAAAVLLRGPTGRDFLPVRVWAMAALVAAVVAAAVAALIAAGSVPSAPLAGTGAAVVAVLTLQSAAWVAGPLALAFTAITLVCERTERQLRDSRRRLRTLANLDTLTQVPNRRHFHELAEKALQRDEPGTAALLIFDIDHFKRINDLFGHAAGDRALRLVSQAVLEHLRAQDVPGRHGGDEFVLLLRHTTPRHALGVASRIVAEVQRQAPHHQLPTLSLSFGVVQMSVGESVAGAMRRADLAMYEAKRQGRSRAVAAMGPEDEPVFWESRPLGLTPA